MTQTGIHLAVEQVGRQQVAGQGKIHRLLLELEKLMVRLQPRARFFRGIHRRKDTYQPGQLFGGRTRFTGIIQPDVFKIIIQIGRGDLRRKVGAGIVKATAQRYSDPGAFNIEALFRRGIADIGLRAMNRQQTDDQHYHQRY